MIDHEELRPPCLDSQLNDIEFCMNAAKKGYLTNQWVCSFISRPLFGMQLWNVNKIMGKEPSLIDGLNQFVKEIELAIPIYKMMINILAEKIGDKK